MGSEKGALTLQYEPYIMKIARQVYLQLNKRFAYEDLLSHAYVASLEAERTYDPEKGTFSTYLRQFLQQQIISAALGIDKPQQNIVNKAYKFIDSYIAQHDAVPSAEIVCEALNVTLKAYEKAMEHAKPVGEPTEESTEDFTEMHDAISRLPRKYQNVIEDYLAERTYNKPALQAALRKLRKIMEV